MEQKKLNKIYRIYKKDLSIDVYNCDDKRTLYSNYEKKKAKKEFRRLYKNNINGEEYIFTCEKIKKVYSKHNNECYKKLMLMNKAELIERFVDNE